MNEKPIENQPIKRARCRVYIDGFNWYYGIFIYKPEWKWLNVQGFFEELRKDEDVDLIRFFTSLVEPDIIYNEARNRQKKYIKALESFKKIKVTYGLFQLGKTKCLASCKEEYQVPQEKKTDVNIALAMILDAIKGETDSIVLVSGDSDLQPAVEWITKNLPKIKVSVYIPSLHKEESQRRSDYYFRIRVPCKFLPLDHVQKYQLPAKFCAIGGDIERPETWK
jgi:uncharacterized LabA/DUF88 family protein